MGTLPRPSRDHVLSDPAGTERYRPIFYGLGAASAALDFWGIAVFA